MRKVSRAVGILGVGLLAGSMAGCVEQEASLSIRGVVEYQGQRSSEAVQCPVEGGGDGMMGETMTKEESVPVLECAKNVEPGNAENFRAGVRIDLSDFKAGGTGQVGTARASGPSQQDICSIDSQSYVRQKYGHPWFEIGLDLENRLKDSNQVGAGGGGGGGGGGFEGLNLNANDIQLKEIVIEYPEISNSADLGLDKEFKVSLIADSNGGGALLNRAIFSSGDIPQLEKLHKQLVKERAGLGSYNDRAKRTTVTIIADIHVKGETLGERPVESTHLEFPIELCGKGCGTTPECEFKEQSGG